MQHKVPLIILKAVTQCQLLLKFVSTRTPRSYSPNPTQLGKEKQGERDWPSAQILL